MAKGDEAVRRRKNKVNRKRLRNSDESVSAHVASIIASKRRRKAGTRRICEGMCFSLPTPEDPFNNRWDAKNKPPQPSSKKLSPKPPPSQKAIKTPNSTDKSEDRKTRNGNEGSGVVSKFLILSLNCIQESWAADGTFNAATDKTLLACEWGIEFWRNCIAGSNVVDAFSGGDCASREQTAWVASTASDIFTMKEKQGLDLACPFLIYLVPSQEKAVQVRWVCKPLKALGIHTVSMHSGAALDHQIQGLKSCEPEFLVSTPERLLELSSQKAIDISGVALLVLDGLKTSIDIGVMDKVKFIREQVSANAQVVIFGDYSRDTSIVRDIFEGSVHRMLTDMS